jgi:hypothetical protein
LGAAVPLLQALGEAAVYVVGRSHNPDASPAALMRRPLGAPAMDTLLHELVAGVPAEQLGTRTAQVLDRIDTGQDREPGEDDE